MGRSPSSGPESCFWTGVHGLPSRIPREGTLPRIGDYHRLPRAWALRWRRYTQPPTLRVLGGAFLAGCRAGSRSKRGRNGHRASRHTIARNHNTVWALGFEVSTYFTHSVGAIVDIKRASGVRSAVAKYHALSDGRTAGSDHAGLGAG